MIQQVSKRYEAYRDSGIDWLGFIPEHWKIRRVKDELLSLDYKRIPLSGDVRGQMTKPVYDYYGASGIIDKVDNYIFDESLILIGEDGANLLMRNSPLAFIARGKYWVNNHAHILKNQKGNLEFFCYLLESFDYTEFVSGSAQPKLTAGALNNIYLMVPPIPEQNAIADYLDEKTAQIDQQIDLLSQKAKHYGELKQALINETVTRGLDKTGPMKDSGIEWIGEIPGHWEISRIKENGTVRGRVGWKALKADEYVDEGYIFLATPNIKNKKIDFDNVNYITHERYIESPEIRLRVGDILLAKDGSTLGTANIVVSLPSEATVNSSIAVIRLKNSVFSKYFFYQVLSDSIQNKISLKKSGMGVPHLFQRDINNFFILLPPYTEQKAIADYLDDKTAQIDAIVETINAQIDNLKTLRKTLINDVVTGKIRIL